MFPLAFIGGAVTGAAGLLAVALWDKKRTEAQYPPTLQSPQTLNPEESAELLNGYFFKAQDLYSKCNDIVLESCDLISTPIEFPDDGLFQKAANCLGRTANHQCRKWRQSQLEDLKKATIELYGRYRGVFIRANKLVLEAGRTGANLGEISYPKKRVKIDSDLENDNWDQEFQEFADTITDFIEKSCQIAESLMDALKQSTAGATALKQDESAPC